MSDLVGNPEDRFSHKEAPISVAFEQDITEIKDLATAEHFTHPWTYMLWVVMDTFLLCVTVERKQVTMETVQEESRMMGTAPDYSFMKERSLKTLRWRLLADCSIQEPSLKKRNPSRFLGPIPVCRNPSRLLGPIPVCRNPSRLLGPIPVCRIRKKRSSKVLEYLERSDRGHERSRSKFYRQKRNKNAHVKWSKKDKMIGNAVTTGGFINRLA